MKGAIAGELLTMSRKWLALGGAVPPGSARPQMSKHQKYGVNTMSGYSYVIHTVLGSQHALFSMYFLQPYKVNTIIVIITSIL